MGRGTADLGFWREAQPLLRTSMSYGEIEDEIERRTGSRPKRTTLKSYAARMKGEDLDYPSGLPPVPNRFGREGRPKQ